MAAAQPPPAERHQLIGIATRLTPRRPRTPTESRYPLRYPVQILPTPLNHNPAVFPVGGVGVEPTTSGL